MECRSIIRTDVETGLATDTSFFIRYNSIGFGNALPSTRRADRNARSLFALLTDNGHEDRDLLPFLYSNPRKGRATGILMGETADHFTGLASCTTLRDHGDSTHLDLLLIWFFIANALIYKYINILFLFVKLFLIMD
jgi:hypothetical protein